jgi:hypothetical protein
MALKLRVTLDGDGAVWTWYRGPRHLAIRQEWRPFPLSFSIRKAGMIEQFVIVQVRVHE